MCLPLSVALTSKMASTPGRMPCVAVADYEAGLADHLYELSSAPAAGSTRRIEAAEQRAVHRRAGERRAARRARAWILVPAPKGSAQNPFAAAEHEARFTQELSSRLRSSVCAEMIGMSKDLDRSTRAGWGGCSRREISS